MNNVTLDTEDYSDFKVTVPIYSDESKIKKLGEAFCSVVNLNYHDSFEKTNFVYLISKVNYLDKDSIDFNNYSYDFYLDNYDSDENFFDDYREKVNKHNREGLPTLTVVEKTHGELSKIISKKTYTNHK